MSHEKKEWPENLLNRIFGAKCDLEFPDDIEERLNKVLRRMKWKLGRSILELRYKKGRNNGEIANILKLDPNDPKMVNVYEGRAIKVLRNAAVRATLLGAPGPISEYLKSAYRDKNKIPVEFLNVDAKVRGKIMKVWTHRHPPVVRYVRTMGDLAYMIASDRIYKIDFLDAGEIAQAIKALLEVGFTEEELGM